jgi:carbon-monoxide dehydrogenase medium subunit
MWQEYHLPTTLKQALDLLARYDGRARVVAGGTDLILEMQQGRTAPVAALVDVTQVEGLNEIRLDDGWIVIGAGVTHTQIVESAILQQRATALVESCGQVGGPQVRNVATLCGNVVHALPAADGTVSLLALDAEGLVATRTGQTWRPLPALFRGPGESAIDSTCEILAAVRFQATGAGEGSAFVRVMRPQGVALPILGVAVWVRLAPDPAAGYAQVRIAVGPAGPVPFRANRAEAALAGAPVGAESSARAIELTLAEAQVRTSKYRATKEYRGEMIRTLLPKALSVAIERARTAR